MGIWDNWFATGNPEGDPEQKPVSWISLNHSDQLEHIKLNSGSRAQVIYKHSTSCGISGMVLKRLEGMLSQSGYDADYYFLDIRRNRQLSDRVAEQYGLRHESPQLLIVRERKVVAAASHGAIAEMDLEAHL